MERKNVLIVFVITTVFSLGLTIEPSAFAVTLNPDDMIGGTCARACGDKGVITLISPTDASQTLIGDPTVEGSLAGLAFDSSGRLWGANNIDTSSVRPFNPISELIQIDPDTGAQIGSSIPLTFNGGPATVQDFAIQPDTDVLFATSHFRSDISTLPHNQLVTIDYSTGAVTLVGPPLPPFRTHSIGFDPITGTLYAADCTGNLRTINPDDASVLSTVTVNVCSVSLGVRSDGAIFTNHPSDKLYQIFPSGGFIPIGPISQPNAIADIAFVPDSEPIPIGGTYIPIDTSALLLAGVQSISMWMIPVVIAGIGIGIFVVKRRN